MRWLAIAINWLVLVWISGGVILMQRTNPGSPGWGQALALAALAVTLLSLHLRRRYSLVLAAVVCNLGVLAAWWMFHERLFFDETPAWPELVGLVFAVVPYAFNLVVLALVLHSMNTLAER